FLDTGGNRFRHHLEVSQLHPAGRELGGRVLLGCANQQLSAGRYRHQDDSYWEEHTQHHRRERNLCRPWPEYLPWTGENPEGRDRCPQLYPVRLASDWREVRRPYVSLHRGQEFYCPDGARSFHFKNRRGPAFLSAPARADGGRCRLHDREWFL